MKKPPQASYFGAKVAFEIPKSLKRVTKGKPWEGRNIPDGLIDLLLDVTHDGAKFETEDICSPDLLILDIREPLTTELIDSLRSKINAAISTFLTKP